MNPYDDNDLIEALQSGIAERKSGISAPDGIGDSARRAARKRTATRAVSAGVPVLAAAGVATVLVTGSGSGSASAGGASASGSGASALVSPAASGGPVKVQDTSYIVKRVRAKIADDAQSSSFVLHSADYTSGDVSSDGTLENLGTERSEGWDYSAPDGTYYQRNSGDTSDPGVTGIGETDPVSDGHQRVSLTVLNANNKTYSVQVTDDAVPANAPTQPRSVGFGSSGSDVQQALQNGQVTQLGTTTIDGTQAIALSVKLPSDEDLDYTLYVDAQSYQPLRTVTVGTGTSNATTYIAELEPATPANIAQAEDNSIPAGYTKVDHPAG